MTDDEVWAMVHANAEGCCMNDQWRGHACDYHQGYTDGLFQMLEKLESSRP